MASEYTYDEDGETWPFFVMAVLSFALVPLTVKWAWRIVSSDRKLVNVPGAIDHSATSLGLENASSLGDFKRKRTSDRIFNKTLVLVVVGWAIVAYIGWNHTKEANLQGTFDPYAILDVAMNASEREIKSRYRKLSLKFHPDKLPQDITDAVKQEMEAAFIKINLAYKSLTDEVTRNNFLRYGHPDGPQDVKHGIALPKFLVEGKYSPLMVVVYFALVGLLLPLVVGRWWSDVKAHTRRGLHVDTAGLFTRKLADRNPAKAATPDMLLEWLVQAHELKAVAGHLEPAQVRQLIDDHFHRKTGPADLQKLQIVAKLPHLINGLIDIANVFRQFDVVSTAVDLHKAVVLAVKPCGRYQELLQLPYVDHTQTEAQPVKRLGKLFAIKEDEAGKALGISDLQKLKTSLSIAAHIPFLRIIDASFKVPGEDEVTPASKAHLVVKFLVKSPRLKSCPQIDDERLKEEETMEMLRNPLKTNDEEPSLPHAYAPYFPEPVANNWYAFILNQTDNRIVEGSEVCKLENVDLLNLKLTQELWISAKEGEVKISTFKIPLTQPTASVPGVSHYRLIMKNNVYFGPDVDIPLTLEVKPVPPKIPQNKEAITEVSDDESDISDPEEDSLAGALAALRGGPVKKIETEEEDSDEDVFTDINTDTEDES